MYAARTTWEANRVRELADRYADLVRDGENSADGLGEASFIAAELKRLGHDVNDDVTF